VPDDVAVVGIVQGTFDSESSRIRESAPPPICQSANLPVWLITSVTSYCPFACNPPGMQTESADKMPVTPCMPSRVMNMLSFVFPLRTSVISDGVHRDLPVKLHRPE